MVSKDTISSTDKDPKYEISNTLMDHVLSCLVKVIQTQSNQADIRSENNQLKQENGQFKE